MKKGEDTEKHIVFICQKMSQKGFITGTDGNVSVKLSSSKYLITPSNLNKGFITEEDLVIIDEKGRKISGLHEPSSEIKMHLTAYEQRPDIGAVIHAHPPLSIAFSVAGISLEDYVLPEVVFTLDCIPTAPFAIPHSQELAMAIKDLIKQRDALILDHHGTLTVGRDVFDAYNKLEKVEHTALVILTAKLLGRVKTLETWQIDMIKMGRKIVFQK